MALDAYRGAVIRPSQGANFQNPSFEVTPDCVTVVDQNPRDPLSVQVALSRPVEELARWSDESLARYGLAIDRDGGSVTFKPRESHRVFLKDEGNAVGPAGTDLHAHLLQPPGIPGPLMREDGSGWLSTTLTEGEMPAKIDLNHARRMIRERLRAMAANGTVRLVGWPTSSVRTANIVLEEASLLGLDVHTGVVLMDRMQGDVHGLNMTIGQARGAYESLLQHAPGQVVMIHRFGIACSETMTSWAVGFARKHGLVFHTHFAESQGEAVAHRGLHNNESIGATYQRQGILGEGLRVVLAHSIHVRPRRIEWIGQNADATIAACPNSNFQLGSHVRTLANGLKDYVPFPYEKWIQAGVPIAFGTDPGAGRNDSIFRESQDERGRQMGFYGADGEFPPEQMLWASAIQGALAMGVDMSTFAIQEGAPANFAVVELSGSRGAYYFESHSDDPHRLMFRYVEGAAKGPDRVYATYCDGRAVKLNGRLIVPENHNSVMQSLHRYRERLVRSA